MVEHALTSEGYKIEKLDGDIVRQFLTKDLGFSKADRVLSQSEQLLSLNGEHTAYYKLNGYSFTFHNYQSDYLGIPNIKSEKFDNLSRDFISDVCVGSEKVIYGQEELK